MQPTQRIHSGASRVNKLTLQNSRLCYNGIECNDVVPPKKGIKNFVNHLVQNYPDGVALIAHNGHRFDFPLLKRDLQKHESVLIDNYPIECIDSISIFKKHFPGLGAYNQPCLIERFVGSENVSDAHEAVGDCINLKRAMVLAAEEKQMALSEFLDVPVRKLGEKLKEPTKKQSGMKRKPKMSNKLTIEEDVNILNNQMSKKPRHRYQMRKR